MSGIRIFVPLLFAAAPAFVTADCACFCLADGPRTVCNTLEEASGDPSVCILRHAQVCEAVADGAANQVASTYGLDDALNNLADYAPAEPGAVNCRDTLVWNWYAARYDAVKTCEVDDAPPPDDDD